MLEARKAAFLANEQAGFDTLADRDRHTAPGLRRQVDASPQQNLSAQRVFTMRTPEEPLASRQASLTTLRPVVIGTTTARCDR